VDRKFKNANEIEKGDFVDGFEVVDAVHVADSSILTIRIRDGVELPFRFKGCESLPCS